jgi:hypothetical protein
MPKNITTMPGLMPVLGRGKHRSPKAGACFMEYASYLAGERWSDHPSCTHPSLAALARLVNDCSSDAGRGQLVTLIPAVVGLLGDGRRSSLTIVARSIAAALPIASHERQRALAAGALRSLPLMDDVRSRALVQSALLKVPDAASWADGFVRSSGALDPRLIDRMCDAIIRTAVIGIAEACVEDPDDRMRDLLASCVEDLSTALVDATALVEAALPLNVGAISLAR